MRAGSSGWKMERITELSESLGNLSQQVDMRWLENDTLLVSFVLTIGDRWLWYTTGILIRKKTKLKTTETNLPIYHFKVHKYLFLQGKDEGQRQSVFIKNLYPCYSKFWYYLGAFRNVVLGPSLKLDPLS